MSFSAFYNKILFQFHSSALLTHRSGLTVLRLLLQFKTLKTESRARINGWYAHHLLYRLLLARDLRSATSWSSCTSWASFLQPSLPTWQLEHDCVYFDLQHPSWFSSLVFYSIDHLRRLCEIDSITRYWRLNRLFQAIAAHSFHSISCIRKDIENQ